MEGERDRPEFGVDMLSEDVRRCLEWLKKKKEKHKDETQIGSFYDTNDEKNLPFFFLQKVKVKQNLNFT